jgi:hypothetical protein
VTDASGLAAQITILLRDSTAARAAATVFVAEETGKLDLIAARLIRALDLT